MDPIQSINYEKDTSLLILLAAKKAGFEIHLMEQQDLFIDSSTPKAFMSEIHVFNDSEKWFEIRSQQETALTKLDVILMRKDPPFDKEYIYSTYILEAASKLGVLVLSLIHI